MPDISTIDKSIKVFISYSWDDELHKEWVLNLANNLQHKGIYVLLDRYDIRAGKSMTLFMEESVLAADKVLLILTPPYKEKVDGRKGGAGYEGAMISQAIYEGQSEKFVPVVRRGDYKNSSPTFIRPLLSHTMTDDSKFDQDFLTLLRIIYSEPEITRPPLGRKPDFPIIADTRPTSIVPKALIDDAKNMEISRMPAFSKWTIGIELTSLEDQDKYGLFSLINSSLIPQDRGSYYLPFILNPLQKISHDPEIIYNLPLHRGMVANLFSSEKLKLDKGILNYEYSEYTDHEFLLPGIMQPFSTILYLLIVIKKAHETLRREPAITLNIEFNSNRKAMLYSTHSPFQVPYLYRVQNMIIRGNNALRSINLKALSIDSIYDVFQKIYGMFTAEDPRSPHPFAQIDRADFNSKVAEFLPR